MSATVGFSGSRDLPHRYLALVRSAALAVLRSGRSVATGCAIGTDQATVAALLDARAARQLEIFGVGGQDGHGFWRCSAFPQVLAAFQAGARVHWWAGGSYEIKLRDRLFGRSAAMLQAIAASGDGRALVAFLATPGSRGTAATMHLANRKGIPVIAFPCGFRPDRLRLLGRGAWAQAAASGFWAQAWRWVPSGVPGYTREDWVVDDKDPDEPAPLIFKDNLHEIIDTLPAEMTIAELREYMPRPRTETLAKRTIYDHSGKVIATWIPRAKDAPRHNLEPETMAGMGIPIPHSAPLQDVHSL